MRAGPLEIVLILLVVFSIVLAVRIFRGDGNVAPRIKTIPLDLSQQQLKQSFIKGNRLKITGVVLVIVGVLLVFLGISTFKWVLRVYLWSFIILIVGLSIMFLSRSRR